MIIVTGAAGALNGATVDRLLESNMASDIVVVTRDLEKARRFAELGLEVRIGDYSKPETLEPAFDGADQLLLVSSNDQKYDPLMLHKAAIDAAVAVGVGRVLYTSHQGASLESPFLPARTHAATEQMLAESGLAWTALRNGFYAHSLPWMIGNWRETGIIEVPFNGAVSWTAREDSAHAAASILAAGKGYEGPVTITASEAITFSDVASIATELVGREIGFKVVGEDAWLSSQVAAGVPEFSSKFTLGVFKAAEAGFFSGTDPLLKDLFGHEPKTVREALVSVAQRH